MGRAFPKTVGYRFGYRENAALLTLSRYLKCRFGKELEKVGVIGFEPTTLCSQSRCASQAALHPER